MMNTIIIIVVLFLVVAFIRFLSGSVNSNHSIVTSAMMGNLPRLKKCIEMGIDIDFKSSGGITALIHAAHNNHIEVVEYLINNGADLDIQDDKGYTALFAAAVNNNVEVVRILLANGADKNIIISNDESISRMVRNFPEGFEEIKRLL